MREQIKIGVFLPCIHMPYQDDKSLDSICRFLGYIKPDILAIGGDFYDFSILSKFTKNEFTLDALQDDLDFGQKYLEKFDKSCKNPKVKKYFMEGNHETRLNAYILDNAKALHSLRVLKPTNLFGLNTLGYEYKTRKDPLIIGDLLIHHGEYIRKHSAYSCKAEVEEKGVSVIMAHTHRIGQYYKTTLNNELVGVESGHLSIPSKHEYVKNKANWQQGFTVFYIHKNKRYSIHPIPIIHNKFIFDRKIFTPTKIIK